MKASASTLALVALLASASRVRAGDVSRRCRARRRLSRRRPAAVPSRQMEVPDRRPDRLVAGLPGRRDLLRRRRRQRLRGGRGRRPPTVEVQDRRTRRLRRPRSPAASSTSAATTASSTRSTRRRAKRGGNSRPEASGGSRRRGCTACCRRTRRSPMRSTSSCRVRSWRTVRSTSAAATATSTSLDAATGALNWKFRTGDVVHASPAYADGVVYFGSWDSYFYAVDAKTGAREMALSRRRGSDDPQPGRIPVVAGGRERRRLHGLPRLEAVCDRCRDRTREVAFRRRRELGDQLAGRRSRQGRVRHVGFEPLRRARRRDRHASSSGSRARPSCSRRRRSRARPSTSASSTARWKRAISRAATCCGTSRPKRRSATPAGCSPPTASSTRRMLYASSWREAPLVATAKQFSVGAIFSSPLVVGGTVYFGSTDGNLYAVE